MSKPGPLRLLAARPNESRNSALVDEALRLLRNGLAHGDEQAVVSPCQPFVGPEEAAKQIRGVHRLSADVLIRLAGASYPDAADDGLNLLHGPIGRGVWRMGPEPSEAAPLASLARLTAEVGDVARAVLDAYSDGALSTAERGALLREVEEAELALRQVRAAVTGSAA